jgi:hypothetical protein
VTGDSVDRLKSGAGLSPSDGQYFIDLNPTDKWPERGGVEQTIDTVAGTSYLVRYKQRTRSCGPPYYRVNRLRASADGQGLVTKGSTFGWSSYSFSFKADDGSATLRFAALNSGRCGAALLDNVTVTALPTGSAVAGSGATNPRYYYPNDFSITDDTVNYTSPETGRTYNGTNVCVLVVGNAATIVSRDVHAGLYGNGLLNVTMVQDNGASGDKLVNHMYYLSYAALPLDGDAIQITQGSVEPN